MQGSGTFGVESVMQTVCKPNHTKFLILENGAYGQRMAKMCKLIGVEYHLESFPEHRAIDLNRVESLLKQNNKFTNVVRMIAKIIKTVKEINLNLKGSCSQ